MKLLVKIFISIVVFITLLLLLRFGAQLFVKYNTKINNSNGIEILEKIQIGGIDQWILIRGENKSNPVLLWLDGGPGEPLISYARNLGYKTGLEKHFVMVYWDQRGTGKSYNSAIPKESMTIEQFVNDSKQLTEYLLKKFNVNKIYLLGRSWGSIIGSLTTSRYPEYYYAYIGVGQVADFTEGEEISYKYVIDKAKEINNTTALNELIKIGPPPHGLRQVLLQRKWLRALDGFSKSDMKNDFIYYSKNVLSSPEYSLIDILNVRLHMGFPSIYLWEPMKKVNFFKQIPKFNLPIYFLEGRYDYTIPSTITEKYFNFVVAPNKKLFWFENSSHTVPNDAPEEFYKTMIKILNETYKK